MADNDESVRRGITIVRWSIGIVFAVAVFTVESPLAVVGGGFLGWCFSAVGQYVGTRQVADQPSPQSPSGGSAWVPKEEAAHAETGRWHSRSPKNVRPFIGRMGLTAPDTPKTKTSLPARTLPVSLWDSGMWPPPDDAIDSGGGLSFTYADANGEVTERRIINWKEDEEYDHCFTGWCTDREMPRSFRIDRVQSWG